MGRPRRIQSEDRIYLVSNRCIDGRAFFRPGPKVNEIVERSLVWAVDNHEIDVFAYVFELNRFEMILGAPRMNLQHFMRDFQSEVATKLKALHGRTERRFFEGRYDSEPFADAGPLVDEIARVVCRPCELGLVDHPRDWPGISSWSQHVGNNTRVVRRQCRQEYWRLRQKYRELDAAEAEELATGTYTMQLQRPFDMEVGDARGLICAEIDALASTYGERRDKPPLGVETVESMPANQPPSRVVRRRRRRVCIASGEESRARFVAHTRNANLWYEWGRRRLRLGMPNPPFPKGMIPLHEVDAVGSRARAGPGERRASRNQRVA